MSERVNNNHNQMGKSSNSRKSLVKEKEKFHRGKRKEGGRWRGGILSSPKRAFFSGNEREALCNTENAIAKAT